MMSQAIAAFELCECVVACASFAGGEIHFYPDLLEVYAVDHYGHVSSPLPLDYADFAHFRASRQSGSLRIAVPYASVLPWAEANQCTAQVEPQSSEGLEAHPCCLLLRLVPEAIDVFFDTVSSTIGANFRASRSASRVSVAAAPLHLCAPSFAHPRTPSVPAVPEDGVETPRDGHGEEAGVDAGFPVFEAHNGTSPRPSEASGASSPSRVSSLDSHITAGNARRQRQWHARTVAKSPLHEADAVTTAPSSAGPQASQHTAVVDARMRISPPPPLPVGTSPAVKTDAAPADRQDTTHARAPSCSLSEQLAIIAAEAAPEQVHLLLAPPVARTSDKQAPRSTHHCMAPRQVGTAAREESRVKRRARSSLSRPALPPSRRTRAVKPANAAAARDIVDEIVAEFQHQGRRRTARKEVTSDERARQAGKVHERRRGSRDNTPGRSRTRRLSRHDGSASTGLSGVPTLLDSPGEAARVDGVVKNVPNSLTRRPGAAAHRRRRAQLCASQERDAASPKDAEVAADAAAPAPAATQDVPAVVSHDEGGVEATPTPRTGEQSVPAALRAHAAQHGCALTILMADEGGCEAPAPPSAPVPSCILEHDAEAGKETQPVTDTTKGEKAEDGDGSTLLADVLGLSSDACATTVPIASSSARRTKSATAAPTPRKRDRADEGCPAHPVPRRRRRVQIVESTHFFASHTTEAPLALPTPSPATSLAAAPAAGPVATATANIPRARPPCDVAADCAQHAAALSVPTASMPAAVDRESAAVDDSLPAAEATDAAVRTRELKGRRCMADAQRHAHSAQQALQLALEHVRALGHMLDELTQ